jgi:hypothetical protein
LKRNLIIGAGLATALAFSVLLWAHLAGAQSARDRLGTMHEEVAALRDELASLRAGAEAASLLAANSYLVDAGFHAMDDAIGDLSIDPRYLTTVRETLSVVAAIQWPEALEGTVAEFVEAAGRLEAALVADDPAAAATPAAEAHDAQHQLSHRIFGYLGGHGNPEPEPESRSTAEGVPIELELGDEGGAAGGASTHAVRHGAMVRLVVRSAAAGTLHVHGYDLEAHVLAGGESLIDFEARAAGRYPIEFHPADDERAVLVGYLEVRP